VPNRDAFSGYHPIVNLIFFASVFVFTMFFMHPVSLLISFAGALSYSFYLKGANQMKHTLKYLVPMMSLAAVINPMFNHEGITILTYLPSGNPLTMESIVYGVFASIMLISVILWFNCYSEVFTSDKFIYIFGRIMPSLSLVISMALRFVPRYKEQFNVIREAQKAVGRDMTDGKVLKRIKNAIAIFSIMITWALENAVETADSMKSRGYGLKGRTAFSIYTFDDRDKALLLWIVFCLFYITSGTVAGGLKWSYYPYLQGNEFTILTISFQAVYLFFCLTPMFINKMEDRKWKHLKYRI